MLLAARTTRVWRLVARIDVPAALRQALPSGVVDVPLARAATVGERIDAVIGPNVDRGRRVGFGHSRRRARARAQQAFAR